MTSEYEKGKELWEGGRRAGKRAGRRETWFFIVPSAVVLGMYVGFWLVNAFGKCS